MRWLDRAYVRLVPRAACFPDGWGDDGVLRTPIELDWRTEAPPVPRPTWTRARAHGRIRIREGELESPEASLPPESRWVRFRWLTPREGRARAFAVALPAWGDEGFDARRRLLAPAVAHGVAVAILENAFYGSRRRVGQRGARLRTVADFVTMGRAAVAEARALLAWGRARGFEDVGVVGFSMGGQMAAMTAAMVPWPVRVVAMAPSISPASVFLDGPLERDVGWERLGPDARPRLREVMERLSVLDLPPPHDPRRARLVGTRRDVIVPPGDVDAIGRHWGVYPRWLDDGHVSAIALRRHALAQAVVDAFA